MIIDVPTAKSLLETGYGWLNLAWDIAIRDVIEFNEVQQQLAQLTETFDEKEAGDYVKAFWDSKTFNLNNTTALAHQAVEILLKAKIASVSPFLLIANDDRSWPKLQDGKVSFYDFKTIEAGNLRKIVDTVSHDQFHQSEIDLFERLRKDRNRIAHLDNIKFTLEVKKINVDILFLIAIFAGDKSWYLFRRPYIARRYSPGDIDIWGNEIDYDILLQEADAAIELLNAADALRYFGIAKRKKRLGCDDCKYVCSKYYDGDASFVQEVDDSRFRCAACGASYKMSKSGSLMKQKKYERKKDSYKNCKAG